MYSIVLGFLTGYTFQVRVVVTCSIVLGFLTGYIFQGRVVVTHVSSGDTPILRARMDSAAQNYT